MNNSMGYDAALVALFVVLIGGLEKIYMVKIVSNIFARVPQYGIS